MRTRADLQEGVDRKEANIFYPSAFKVEYRSVRLGCFFGSKHGLVSLPGSDSDCIAVRPLNPNSQLLKFIDWQVQRASLALPGENPSSGVNHSGVQW